MDPSSSPSPKKRKISYSSFDEGDFVKMLLERQGDRRMCCGKSCFMKITASSLKAHAMLLGFYHSLDPPDTRNRVFRSFVMSCFMVHVDDNKKCSKYRIPAVGHSLCKETWLLLMNISRPTFDRWRALTLSTCSVLPINHGLVFSKPNAAKPKERAAVRQYLCDVAETQGHPLPVSVGASDYSRLDAGEAIESIVFHPPRFSKRVLAEQFISLQTDESLCVHRSTFNNIMEKEFPHIRVSLRARGLCDICFVYRDLVRKVSDNNLSRQAMEWRAHLDLAEITRQIYRRSLTRARTEAKYLLPLRLKSATVSYDYAKQISIPLLSEQTMNEWFAQKKGYDVNLFGILDEGTGANGMQNNYIYGEGTKHGSIQVASMLNHFFTKTNAPIGRSETLFLHSDSCTGQNKNNIVLGYFMLRVALGYHENIIWQFMAVGHTKFRPDEGFGLIRTYVEGRANIMSMTEMKEAIEASASSNRCILFPVADVQDWKHVNETFKPLFGIRKYFAYVDIYHEPGAEEPNQSFNLVKPGTEFPSLDSFPYVAPAQLTVARRTGLQKDVYSVLLRNRIGGRKKL